MAISKYQQIAYNAGSVARGGISVWRHGGSVAPWRRWQRSGISENNQRKNNIKWR